PAPPAAGPPPAGRVRPASLDVDAARLAEAFHGEGLYRLQRGDVEIAVQRLARAVQEVPSNPVYRGDYGRALFLAGNSAAAVVQLEEAIRLAPRHAPPHATLAEVLLAQGDTTTAVQAYER